MGKACMVWMQLKFRGKDLNFWLRRWCISNSDLIHLTESRWLQQTNPGCRVLEQDTGKSRVSKAHEINLLNQRQSASFIVPILGHDTCSGALELRLLPMCSLLFPKALPQASYLRVLLATALPA